MGWVGEVTSFRLFSKPQTGRLTVLRLFREGRRKVPTPITNPLDPDYRSSDYAKQDCMTAYQCHTRFFANFRPQTVEHWAARDGTEFGLDLADERNCTPGIVLCDVKGDGIQILFNQSRKLDPHNQRARFLSARA